MATFFARSAIVTRFLLPRDLSPESEFARTLKGTIRSGKYIAPNDRFSFAVPPNTNVQDRIKVIFRILTSINGLSIQFRRRVQSFLSKRSCSKSNLLGQPWAKQSDLFHANYR